MKSDEGSQIIKAWAENLDDVNNIVKNFTPNMAQDLIRASNLKSIRRSCKNSISKMGITRP